MLVVYRVFFSGVRLDLFVYSVIIDLLRILLGIFRFVRYEVVICLRQEVLIDLVDLFLEIYICNFLIEYTLVNPIFLFIQFAQVFKLPGAELCLVGGFFFVIAFFLEITELFLLCFGQKRFKFRALFGAEHWLLRDGIL